MASTSQPFEYPTPAMVEATRAATRGANSDPRTNAGTSTPLFAPQITTSSMTAPLVGGPGAGRLSFRQRLGILIFGADAGRVLFPPQQPLQPVAQAPDFAALGRQWDYPVGWNTRVTPRTGVRIGFPFLKALAEYDIVRIMIERVKENIASQQWNIGPKDKKAARDGRMDQIEDLLAYPDKTHTWRDWLWELMEQALVYDAPAIWLRPTRGGDLYSLEVMDGALFTPKIMGDGRLPPPEYGPAFQQVIKGLPAVDYILPVPKGQPVPEDPNGDPFPELLYKPRNPRVDIPYGYGPVEQIIRTIEIGTKREEFLLDYYTAGSIPDLMIGAPDTWNPNQIAEFQALFDSLLLGNLKNRRGVRFLPGGTRPPYEPRKEALTDATDDWLVRVCCFAFGLSPMPFTKMMNRASGEQHAEQQKEEGTQPYLRWIADLMNHVIRLKFGYRDVVFQWDEEVETDPLEEAQRNQIYCNAKVLHPDEVRQSLGMEVMPDDMRLEMDMPNFAQTATATVLPDEQAEAKQQQALDLAAAKPAPVVGAPGAPGAKPAAPGVAAAKLGKGRSSRWTRSERRY